MAALFSHFSVLITDWSTSWPITHSVSIGCGGRRRPRMCYGVSADGLIILKSSPIILKSAPITLMVAKFFRAISKSALPCLIVKEQSRKQNDGSCTSCWLQGRYQVFKKKATHQFSKSYGNQRRNGSMCFQSLLEQCTIWSEKTNPLQVHLQFSLIWRQQRKWKEAPPIISGEDAWSVEMKQLIKTHKVTSMTNS